MVTNPGLCHCPLALACFPSFPPSCLPSRLFPSFLMFPLSSLFFFSSVFLPSFSFFPSLSFLFPLFFSFPLLPTPPLSLSLCLPHSSSPSPPRPPSPLAAHSFLPSLVQQGASSESREQRQTTGQKFKTGVTPLIFLTESVIRGRIFPLDTVPNFVIEKSPWVSPCGARSCLQLSRMY